MRTGAPPIAVARHGWRWSFDAVAFFDFSVGEARFAFVAHAGFGQIKIIVQVLQFLAQRGDLLALPMD